MRPLKLKRKKRPSSTRQPPSPAPNARVRRRGKNEPLGSSSSAASWIYVKALPKRRRVGRRNNRFIMPDAWPDSGRTAPKTPPCQFFHCCSLLHLMHCLLLLSRPTGQLISENPPRLALPATQRSGQPSRPASQQPDSCESSAPPLTITMLLSRQRPLTAQPGLSLNG